MGIWAQHTIGGWKSKNASAKKVGLTGVEAAHGMERAYALRHPAEKRCSQRLENHGRCEMVQCQWSETINGGTTMRRTGADAPDPGKRWGLTFQRESGLRSRRLSIWAQHEYRNRGWKSDKHHCAESEADRGSNLPDGAGPHALRHPAEEKAIPTSGAPLQM